MLGNVRMSACRRVACVGAQALLAGAGDGVLAERKKEPSGGGCGRSRGTRLGSSAASTNLPAPRFAYWLECCMPAYRLAGMVIGVQASAIRSNRLPGLGVFPDL